MQLTVNQHRDTQWSPWADTYGIMTRTRSCPVCNGWSVVKFCDCVGCCGMGFQLQWMGDDPARAFNATTEGG
jgi:hypothetical protein